MVFYFLNDAVRADVVMVFFLPALFSPSQQHPHLCSRVKPLTFRFLARQPRVSHWTALWPSFLTREGVCSCQPQRARSKGWTHVGGLIAVGRSLGRTCHSGLENPTGRQRRVAFEASDAVAPSGQTVGEVQVWPEVPPWSTDTHWTSGAPSQRGVRPMTGPRSRPAVEAWLSPKSLSTVFSSDVPCDVESHRGERPLSLCTDDPGFGPAIPSISVLPQPFWKIPSYGVPE